MCGLAGFWGDSSALNATESNGILKSMSRAIAHRGPDGNGNWYDQRHGVGLCHTRLAVIDLSTAGHQPMVSATGRYVLTFNGEIYNHQSIRQQLESVSSSIAWRGHSDTETLLASFEQWGIEASVKRATGMFAFAVWDTQAGTLTLARDRLGEKPLYYGWQGVGSRRVFLFGSELKALQVHPEFKAAVDRKALALLMRHNYIPAPYSIFKGVHKLAPGTTLTLSARDATPVSIKYWSAIRAATSGTSSPFQGSQAEAIHALDAVLKKAVLDQMAADVPLGGFLSGGVDSSVVVALMQAQSKDSIKTFTIGFTEKNYDEAPHARAVARHLGTDHTELYVTASDALAIVPKLGALYDEPFADPSQIPTVLLSELAKQRVTVSLSGDGGDELFCGYTRYASTQKLWRWLSRLPQGLRHRLAKYLACSPFNEVELLSRLAQKMSHTNVNVFDRVQKGASLLLTNSIDDLYYSMVSHLPDPAQLVLGLSKGDVSSAFHITETAGTLSPMERMMALDLETYLPDDILVKVDRAAMSIGLETRVPFLDHQVVEFAWSLPLNLKSKSEQSKWVLKELLARYVPRDLIERPKKGFGVPLDTWLRGPLKAWADALLNETRLEKEGYFQARALRNKWDEHLSGRRNWSYHLWSALMFQSWLEHNSPVKHQGNS
jgi:asparagine synthase (glutamine-hydrolysing)